MLVARVTSLAKSSVNVFSAASARIFSASITGFKSSTYTPKASTFNALLSTSFTLKSPENTFVSPEGIMCISIELVSSTPYTLNK